MLYNYTRFYYICQVFSYPRAIAIATAELFASVTAKAVVATRVLLVPDACVVAVVDCTI